jgi:1-acyl-sn-glycerol-3-phosphate acyltransferase
MRLPALRPYIRAFALILVTGGLFGAAPANAKNGYESLVRDTRFDEFPVSHSLTESQIQSMRKSLDISIEKLRVDEGHLIEMKNEIEGQGYTAISLLQTVQSLLASMDQETLEKVLAANADELNAMNIPQVRRLHAILGAVMPKMEHLFLVLDEYIQDSVDLSVVMVMYTLQMRLGVLNADEQTPELRKSFEKLIGFKKAYVDNKAEYGRGHDINRTTAYQRFFQTAKDIFLQLNYPRTYKIRRAANRAGMGLKYASWIVRNPLVVPQFIDTLIRVIINQQPKGQNNPVMASVLRLSRGGRIAMGLKVKIEGEENLLGLENDGVNFKDNDVFIYAPSHRDYIKDQIALAYLKKDNLMPFAASHSFPGWISSRLNTNMGFVPVGGQKGVFTDAIEKAVMIVENTQLRSFVNYPGGRLPEGIGATMGVRKKFFSEDGLVRAFEDKGYRVNIVPISLRDNAKLFGGRTLTRKDDEITIKVRPLLKADTRYLITKLAGQDAISLVMRFGLIEDLVTNDELLWGQVRGSVLPHALNEFLFGDDSCEGLMVSRRSI